MLKRGGMSWPVNFIAGPVTSMLFAAAFAVKLATSPGSCSTSLSPGLRCDSGHG